MVSLPGLHWIRWTKVKLHNNVTCTNGLLILTSSLFISEPGRELDEGRKIQLNFIIIPRLFLHFPSNKIKERETAAVRWEVPQHIFNYSLFSSLFHFITLFLYISR